MTSNNKFNFNILRIINEVKLYINIQKHINLNQFLVYFNHTIKIYVCMVIFYYLVVAILLIFVILVVKDTILSVLSIINCLITKKKKKQLFCKKCVQIFNVCFIIISNDEKILILTYLIFKKNYFTSMKLFSIKIKLKQNLVINKLNDSNEFYIMKKSRYLI